MHGDLGAAFYLSEKDGKGGIPIMNGVGILGRMRTAEGVEVLAECVQQRVSGVWQNAYGKGRRDSDSEERGAEGGIPATKGVGILAECIQKMAPALSKRRHRIVNCPSELMRTMRGIWLESILSPLHYSQTAIKARLG